jgi:hypothetical protein
MSDAETGAEEIGESLLRDVLMIFDGLDDSLEDEEGETRRPVAKITSKTLAFRLNQIEPWSDWRRGKGLTQNSLAGLLRDFKIIPRTVRLSSGKTARGYVREQFEEQWNRYNTRALLLSEDSKRHNDTTRMATRENGDFEVTHEEGVFHSENGSNPHEQGDVSVCQPETPQRGNGAVSRGITSHSIEGGTDRGRSTMVSVRRT